MGNTGRNQSVSFLRSISLFFLFTRGHSVGFPNVKLKRHRREVSPDLESGAESEEAVGKGLNLFVVWGEVRHLPGYRGLFFSWNIRPTEQPVGLLNLWCPGIQGKRKHPCCRSPFTKVADIMVAEVLG
ncbi:hypothetical protein chiPu_0017961 [Chiloscyllium punctatum]|uniref:Uncharacterized protein n=1 Tax=Chiloscyllium punctatum TaxID=137246 RepID=A0A401RK32_CHIPU|nr:hypothetical protein [Chiloscyllium punctatum]